MIEPKTPAEQLLYCTVRLELKGGSVGTGFIFQFKVNDTYIPVIITNKHVIGTEENIEVCFSLHVRSSTNSINVCYKPKWHYHPDYDLCFCYLNPLLSKIKVDTQKEIKIGRAHV